MRAAKTDGNQKRIVEILRDHGVHVFPAHTVGRGFPDLVCAYRGRVYLVEIKDGSRLGWKLTDDQKKFRALFPVDMICSEEDALAWIGSRASKRPA